MKTNYMNYADFKKGWIGGGRETPCGSGSKFENTEIQREWIPRMVEKYGIQSIADIGAGDLNWASRTVFGCDYHPFDLFPRTHGVEELDILTDDMPVSDCLMVLWVINHLHPENQKLAVDKLTSSSARYLIMTWDNRMESCTDLPYIEKEILRHDRGIDFEIRLCEL